VLSDEVANASGGREPNLTRLSSSFESLASGGDSLRSGGGFGARRDEVGELRRAIDALRDDADRLESLILERTEGAATSLRRELTHVRGDHASMRGILADLATLVHRQAEGATNVRAATDQLSGQVQALEEEQLAQINELADLIRQRETRTNRAVRTLEANLQTAADQLDELRATVKQQATQITKLKASLGGLSAPKRISTPTKATATKATTTKATATKATATKATAKAAKRTTATGR
jgi:chromosome segregation ATPase